MYQLTPTRARQAGLSLLELMITLAILGIGLAIGVPSMSKWLQASKAAGATEFYLEGFRFARQQALNHNAASRIVLSANTDNGQLDWQVDICFPTPAVPCSDTSGSWSTPTSVASGDPETAAGYTSVRRPATSLPATEVLDISVLPDGTSSIYYTSLGWVDTNFTSRTTSVLLAPTSTYASAIRRSSVVVTLAGVATKCDPTLAVTDSRACPP